MSQEILPKQPTAKNPPEQTHTGRLMPKTSRQSSVVSAPPRIGPTAPAGMP